MVSLLHNRNVRSLMDLGCGQQACGHMLAETVDYYPVDQYRHIPSTIVKDFNKGEFLEIPVDVIFCSGVLEYIYDLDSLLEKFARYGKTVLCSYCCTDTHPNRATIWVNHLSHSDFIKLFERHGFSLEQELFPDNECGNHIYFFRKQPSSKEAIS